MALITPKPEPKLEPKFEPKPAPKPEPKPAPPVDPGVQLKTLVDLDALESAVRKVVEPLPHPKQEELNKIFRAVRGL